MDGNLYCLGGVGIIFILVGLGAAFSAFKNWMRYRESESWIPVPGQIATSQVTSHRGSKSMTYNTWIVYDYQVMGQSYQGNRFSFGSEGTGYGSGKDAEKVTARYPVGSQATIYCDPNDPSQSVLERKYDPTSAILSVIFGLVGVGITVYSYLQLAVLGN